MTRQSREVKKMMDEMERAVLKTDRFEAMGKGDDFVFQILSFMGEGTHALTVANTIAANSDNDVPEELKVELAQLASVCDTLKNKIRASQQ